jgi:3-hydroxyisobutyrate dehydrogenase
MAEETHYPTRSRVGFIGLGVMGANMAGHIARAGHDLRVLDVDERAQADFLKRYPAAQGASSPADVGRGRDVVITMLPDGLHVRRVVDGAEGLSQSLPAGAILLDTSSSEPWHTSSTADLLAATGVHMVDAPVSGAQWGAEAAELVFMAGGELDHLEKVRPLLDLMGREVFHVGPLGSGHAMKCINNVITAMTLVATAEGLALGAAAGLDPAAMTDVLNESTGMSWITENHIPQRILSRTFDDPFRLELMLKDMGIAIQLARRHGVPTPVCALGEQLYRTASLAAGPGSSLSELARWVERNAGTEIAPDGRGMGTLVPSPEDG